MPTAHQLSPKVIESAMRRALELAAQGPSPDENPQVGCVILDALGDTVAEGWHQGAGTAHAEVMALAQLPADAPAAELTAVVTLEPCNHTGRTGPCAEALRERGIGSVAFGLADPGADSGGGSARLRASGTRVSGGVLEAEVREFLQPWLATQNGAASV